MNDETAVLKADSICPFFAEQFTKGWPRSGFTRKITEMKVRRVQSNGIAEVQIEFEIIEFKGDGERMYRHCGGMVLDSAQANKLVEAIQKVKTYA